MNLVLVSRSSLDELEELAKTNFTDVPNKDLPYKDFSNETFYTKEHSFSRIFKVVPDKNLKQLKFVWIIPAASPIDVSKTARYLSHVIGHEGPNSLLSMLIKEGLSQALSSGSHPRLNYAIDEFSITIDLTENGEKNYEKVIEMVYTYLNKIKKEGPLDYVYNELKQKNLIDFNNMTKNSALRAAQSHARRLMYNGRCINDENEDEIVSNILINPYLYENFNKEEMIDFLNKFKVDNSFIIFSSYKLKDDLEKNPDLYQKEYWYSKNFKIEKISDEFKEKLHNILPD